MGAVYQRELDKQPGPASGLGSQWAADEPSHGSLVTDLPEYRSYWASAADCLVSVPPLPFTGLWSTSPASSLTLLSVSSELRS